MLQLHRSNGTISCAGQQSECHQGAVASFYFCFGRHLADYVLDLFYGWCFLMSFCSRNSGVLVRYVEIFGIGILNARFIARFPGQPFKETFELSKGSMQGCLAEFLSRPLPFLFGKMSFKGDGLFMVPARLIQNSAKPLPPSFFR